MVRRPKGALKIFLEHSLEMYFKSFVAESCFNLLKQSLLITGETNDLALLVLNFPNFYVCVFLKKLIQVNGNQASQSFAYLSLPRCCQTKKLEK